GAGSAGMHHTHAARQLGWDVDLFDSSIEALERVKGVYAARYGAWDEKIDYFPMGSNFYKNLFGSPLHYDLIIIATPPASHIDLALEALKESPGAILIEKPLCLPKGVNRARTALMGQETPIYVGYTHTFSLDKELLSTKARTLDVEFRENWSYILKAHPWLKDQNDPQTYLGDVRLGGGPLCEHSHGL